METFQLSYKHFSPTQVEITYVLGSRKHLSLRWELPIIRGVRCFSYSQVSYLMQGLLFSCFIGALYGQQLEYMDYGLFSLQSFWWSLSHPESVRLISRGVFLVFSYQVIILFLASFSFYLICECKSVFAYKMLSKQWNSCLSTRSNVWYVSPLDVSSTGRCVVIWTISNKGS